MNSIIEGQQELRRFRRGTLLIHEEVSSFNPKDIKIFMKSFKMGEENMIMEGSSTILDTIPESDVLSGNRLLSLAKKIYSR